MKHFEKAEESKACTMITRTYPEALILHLRTRSILGMIDCLSSPTDQQGLNLGEKTSRKSGGPGSLQVTMIYGVGIGGIFRQPCQEETIFSVHPAASKV
jgi:hypothetical protein